MHEITEAQEGKTHFLSYNLERGGGGRILSRESTNKTRRHLLRPLWHGTEARVVA